MMKSGRICANDCSCKVQKKNTILNLLFRGYDNKDDLWNCYNFQNNCTKIAEMI